jgi:hypothetical protein
MPVATGIFAVCPGHSVPEAEAFNEISGWIYVLYTL